MIEDRKPPYCNFESGQDGYETLTCEKWTLSEVKILGHEESVGWHRTIKIHKCFKCKNHWKIFEEYDSHHGYIHKAEKRT